MSIYDHRTIAEAVAEAVTMQQELEAGDKTRTVREAFAHAVNSPRARDRNDPAAAVYAAMRDALERADDLDGDDTPPAA